MELPGGPLANRPLHFVFLADCSGSMAGEKIASLNHAIRDAIPKMREVAANNPNAKVLVRAIGFESTARWLMPTEVPVEGFEWRDLAPGGATAMGGALRLLADVLRTESMPSRALPPVLVLISDGAPTDDFRAGLAALMAQAWGKKAVRIAIAIGDDADLSVLRQFIGNPEVEPLVARNAEQLVNFIRWASTAVLQAASAPPSRTTAPSSLTNVSLPPPPAPTKAADVW